MSPDELHQLRGRDIAVIFQEPMTALNPIYTVGDQIVESLLLHTPLRGGRAQAEAVEALRRVGIDEPERRAHSYPHQLSGGQRQRAMIAMALACNPKLLIADEPTTALDVTIRLQILELLERLRAEAGMALLLITHDLNLVRRFADRVAVMEKGVLVEQGPTAQVIERPQHPYTQKLVNSRPTRDVGRPGSGEVVKAKQVHVHYPTRLPGIRGWFKSGRFTAVESVDFDLAPGETLGVIGESGSGKTTLALAVLGLMPAQGEIRVSEQDLGRERAERRSMRKDIQVVFQDPLSSLSPRLTVEQIIGEGLEIHEPGLDAEARRKRIVRGAVRRRPDRKRPRRAAARALPARILGRPAPAHRHRARADREAEGGGARRAHQRARRHDPEAGARALVFPAEEIRAELHPGHARHRRGARHGAPCDGDEGQQDRGERAARAGAERSKSDYTRRLVEAGYA